MEIKIALALVCLVLILEISVFIYTPNYMWRLYAMLGLQIVATILIIIHRSKEKWT